MWELDHKENWAQKNLCLWTVVLEKTLESPFDCKEIKPVNPKKNKPWIFIGRPDAETEAPILWPFDANSRLIGKDADGGKDWRQEEKSIIDDKMVGWHHQLDGHEFEQAQGVVDRPKSLACCSPWVAESDTTERLNWTDPLCISDIILKARMEIRVDKTMSSCEQRLSLYISATPCLPTSGTQLLKKC